MHLIKSGVLRDARKPIVGALVPLARQSYRGLAPIVSVENVVCPRFTLSSINKGNPMKDPKAMDELQRLLEEMQAHVKAGVISGLRDPDPVEREGFIALLRDNFIPALQHHRNPATARMAVSALKLLIAECRPPRTDAEDFLLDEAIFVYSLSELNERSQEQGQLP
jgi:hypothetical protein